MCSPQIGQRLRDLSPGSTQNENDLIRMAAERAIDKFAPVAASQ